MKYNKIFIVGGIGSGKTTLSNKLSKILNIKNYELDNIAYKRRDIHEKRNPKERDQKVKAILKKKNWIVEGFYSRPWIYPFYKEADTVLILNIKPSTSKKRVIKRFLKRKLTIKRTKKHNKQLKVMLYLLKSIDEYQKKYFKTQEKTAKKFNKNVLILKNKKEIKDFLKNLK